MRKVKGKAGAQVPTGQWVYTCDDDADIGERVTAEAKAAVVKK